MRCTGFGRIEACSAWPRMPYGSSEVQKSKHICMYRYDVNGPSLAGWDSGLRLAHHDLFTASELLVTWQDLGCLKL